MHPWERSWRGFSFDGILSIPTQKATARVWYNLAMEDVGLVIGIVGYGVGLYWSMLEGAKQTEIYERGVSKITSEDKTETQPDSPVKSLGPERANA